MKITFSRNGGRARVICRRTDGTFTSGDLGPSLPAHDLAHFIVEQALQLPAGFFVSIAKGYSIQELSDATTVRSLGAEPYVAEILARALGSLAMGACTADEFPELVGTEFQQTGLRVPEGVSAESATRMLEALQLLLTRFAELAPGELMELQFCESP
jgi:hypothetical protein